MSKDISHGHSHLAVDFVELHEQLNFVCCPVTSYRGPPSSLSCGNLNVISVCSQSVFEESWEEAWSQEQRRNAAYWLVSRILFSYLFIQPKYTCLGDDTTHSGLGPPTLISSQENDPTDMPMGQSNGNNSSFEASPFYMSS